MCTIFTSADLNCRWQCGRRSFLSTRRAVFDVQCHFHFALCRPDGTRGRASRLESIFRSTRVDFLSKLKPNHVPLRNEHVRNSTNELSSALHKLFFYFYVVFAAVVCFLFCVCVCLCALRTIYSIFFVLKFILK